MPFRYATFYITSAALVCDETEDDVGERIRQGEIGLNELMNVAREFERTLRKERELCMYVYNIVARTLRVRAPIFPYVLCIIVRCAFVCVLCPLPPLPHDGGEILHVQVSLHSFFPFSSGPE